MDTNSNAHVTKLEPKKVMQLSRPQHQGGGLHIWRLIFVKKATKWKKIGPRGVRSDPGGLTSLCENHEDVITRASF